MEQFRLIAEIIFEILSQRMIGHDFRLHLEFNVDGLSSSGTLRADSALGSVVIVVVIIVVFVADGNARRFVDDCGGTSIRSVRTFASIPE